MGKITYIQAREWKDNLHPDDNVGKIAYTQAPREWVEIHGRERVGKIHERERGKDNLHGRESG